MSQVAAKCPKCNKTVAGSERGSLTAWLFRQAECRCESGNLVETRAEPSSLAEKKHRESNSNLVGELIDDRYELLALLGWGGMGSVYKAFDRYTKGTYALKIISKNVADTDILAKRVEQEAKAAKSLTHANIVPVYEAGKGVNGAPYLVMEYIDGENLEYLLRAHKSLQSDRAVRIFIEIAEALVHAHQKGVIHRDLKPSNILLTKTEGGAELVKIVDFGIAKISDEHNVDKTKLTQTGELLGSPLYMSPEQCRGDELDTRSDLYSLGCIMYETLVGRPPFDGENPVRILLKHISDTPVPLPKQQGINLALRQVVMRCLEKDPADRYQSAVPLLKDLERIREGKQFFFRRIRWNKRLVRKFAPLAAALALGVAAVGYLMYFTDAQHSSNSGIHTEHRPDTYQGRSLNDLTDAIEQSPKDPSLYFDRGWLHFLRDERSNAIDDFTEAIALKPDFVFAYIRRSLAYMMVAKYDLAMKDANKAISLDPNTSGCYVARGRVFSAKEEYKQASDDFKHAIDIRGDSEAYGELARVLTKLGDYKGAEDAISEVSHGSYSNTWLDSLSGLIAIFKQDYSKASYALRKVTTDKDTDAWQWGVLAYYNVATGNMPEAERAINQMKALDTFPARAFRLAGEVYRTAGQEEKAIKEFSASTSLEEYPPGRRQRAVTYLQLEQLQSAKSDLEKSLERNPDSSTTLACLAMVESRLGMREKAKEHILKAFEHGDVQPPIVYANKAAVELDQGDKTTALKDANKALSLDPWLKEGYQIRAQIYDRLQDPAAATADRSKAAGLLTHLDL
jgi:serine/threonine protein kinase/Tfp pilus assembly protein PilF